MYCPDIIGRDSWVWDEQKTLYKTIPPQGGGISLHGNYSPLSVLKHDNVRAKVIVVVVVVVVVVGVGVGVVVVVAVAVVVVGEG